MNTSNAPTFPKTTSARPPIDFAAAHPTSTHTAASIQAVQLLIIGSGPAGLTAAIYAARADLAPLVLAGATPGGQLMLTSQVENYPGFPAGIEGPDLMAAFRAQAERFGATIINAEVERVDLGARPFRVWAGGVEYQAAALIVASGARSRWLGLANETRLRGRGVSSCATCDGFFFRGQNVAVAGGGDTALEEALFLTRFAARVHLLVRRDTLRASKILVARTQAHPAIEIHLNTIVTDILGAEHVENLRLQDTSSRAARDLAVAGLFVAIGHEPNSGVFQDWLETDAQGYLVSYGETGSSVEGVFIAGDAHDQRYRQAVTAAGDGARTAIDAARWLEVRAASVQLADDGS